MFIITKVSFAPSPFGVKAFGMVIGGASKSHLLKSNLFEVSAQL